jgi:hypothetical protein
MANVGFLGNKAFGSIDELVFLFFDGLTRLRFTAYPLKSDHARLLANTTGLDNASCVTTPYCTLVIDHWIYRLFMGLASIGL